ncbi:lysoplasmalogenase family protein [Agrococcus sp. SL85]|uniref:lysoplasmalogenase family protein n=1 Tax=Agrococcus sp. SL85 TaxID=2995141 RepID=UPI00226CAFFA|nr:lysoplasmalogenase family protein [Agrococcus sp. SL85]WAC65979.1 lysoplasmalogenase family protein [Agrococcus sp. SL85]
MATIPATTTRLPRALRVALLVVAAALAVNLVCATLVALDLGDPDALDLARRGLMWLLVPPIVVALVLLGALRHAVGRWHVAAAGLCALGDGLGAASGQTVVLLACFLAGHVAYALALWPTRRRSLAWGPGSIAYAIVGLIAAGIIAAGAGPLAIPVIAYALVLAGVAALAAIDTAGFLGGLLFLASDLILGLGLFVLEIPDPLRSIAVLVAYAGAQALLAVSLVRRLRLGDPAAPIPQPAPSRTTSTS